MDNKRIVELADFFYSSDETGEVPFRLSLSFGMGGADITYDGFIRLMKYLSDGEINKQSANELLEDIDTL